MPKDKTRGFTSIRTENGDKRSIKEIRKLVLRLLNLFISNVDKLSVGYDFHVDSFKGIINGNLSGLFTDSGILGMLEASDLDRIDEVYPFIGEIIDRCCVETTKAPVTIVFTIYVNLLNDIYYRINTPPGCTYEDFGRFDYIILEFKTIGKIGFERYQKSGMGTSKWHLLDHLLTDLRRTGGASVDGCTTE